MDRNSDDSGVAHAEVRALALRHLGMGGSVFHAPSIPADKEASARRVHALHLPEEEPILVLYDATVFGGADDGFVVTPRRLCWKNLWEHPRQLAWAELDPASVSSFADKIHVAGGRVTASGEVAPGAAALFVALAARSHSMDLGPYRASAPGSTFVEGARLSIERLLVIGRRTVGEVTDVFYHPSIPAAKERRARAVHAAHLPEDEIVVVLYDDTVFGSAEEGFLLTSERLCWKNLTDPAVQIPWSHLDPQVIRVSGSRVLVTPADGGLLFSARAELVEPTATLLRRAAEEARASS